MCTGKYKGQCGEMEDTDLGEAHESQPWMHGNILRRRRRTTTTRDHPLRPWENSMNMYVLNSVLSKTPNRCLRHRFFISSHQLDFLPNLLWVALVLVLIALTGSTILCLSFNLRETDMSHYFFKILNGFQSDLYGRKILFPFEHEMIYCFQTFNLLFEYC